MVHYRGSAFLDEDDLSSDSDAETVASQQSIKAYVGFTSNGTRP